MKDNRKIKFTGHAIDRIDERFSISFDLVKKLFIHSSKMFDQEKGVSVYGCGETRFVAAKYPKHYTVITIWVKGY